jgi:hypothetical protein
VEADSWQPATSLSYRPQDVGAPMQALDGGARLPFASEIKVTPDVQAASTPAG